MRLELMMRHVGIEKLKENFYSIEQGRVRSYMFVGLDRILLVDTGFPDSDILDQVKKVANLPIEVIFTHADWDHTGESGPIKNKYIHPAEMDYYKQNNDGNMPLLPVWEGDKIEIGGYVLEVVHLPGHTPGSIGLIERKQRFMLTGDCIKNGPIFMYGYGRNFQAFHASMIKLKAMSHEVDIFYACHKDREMKTDIVDDLIVGSQKIINKELSGQELQKDQEIIYRYEYGKASFYLDEIL